MVTNSQQWVRLLVIQLYVDALPLLLVLLRRLLSHQLLYLCQRSFALIF